MATKLAARSAGRSTTWVNDRYELVRRLGRGGGGDVHLALDHAREEAPRALKVLAAEADPGERERLRAEFARLAALTHPHLLRVHDLEVVRPGGPLPAGTLFFTADVLDGEPLLARMTAAPPGERNALLHQAAGQVASALAELHAAGLTHHDVKPANLLVDPSGKVVLADLGLASGRGVGQPARGTPAYMAPEAFIGSDDPAVDLYALGATLYELAAGRPPHLGEGAALLRAALHGTVAPVEAQAPWLSPELGRLIHQLLAPRPEERPASAAAVLAALDRIAEGLGVAETAPLAWPVRAPLCGRQAELAALVMALGGGPAIVLVSGEAGSGRRRLLATALRQVQLAMAAGQLDAAEVMGDTLARAAPRLIARAKHVASPRLSAWLAGAQAAEADPVRARAALASELAETVLAATASGPFLLALGDAREPDGLAALLLAALLRGGDLGTRPFTIAAEVTPPAAAALAAVDALRALRTIQLAPLPDAAVLELAAAVVPGAPREALRAIVEVAAGSPAVALEVARALAARLLAGPASLAEACAVVRLARGDGLVELLTGRMAPRAPAERELLVALAVAGQADPGELAAWVGRALPEVMADLIALSRAGLVIWQGALAALPSAAHARAAEGLGLATTRDRFHRAALAASERRGGSARARARHLLRVGSPREAAQAATAAAGEARAALDLPGALGHLEDAAQLSSGEPAAELALEAAELATALADYDRAAGLLARARTGARTAGLGNRLALAAARLAQRQGDYDVAEAAALGLIGDSRRPDSELGLEARALVARVRIARARYRDALAIAEPGLAAALPRATPAAERARAAVCEAAGLARFYLGDLDGAAAAFNGVAQVAERLGDPALAARARSLGGMVAQQRGQLDEAARDYAAALTLSRSVSDVHGAAIYAANLGAALKERAEYAAALAPTGDAIRDLGRLGRTAELAGALFNRGVLCIALGDLAAAERAAERARAASRAPAAPLMQGYASLLEGDLARRQQRLAAAITAYQSGERLFVDAGAAREADLARLNLADALTEAGDFAGTTSALGRLGAAGDRDLTLRAALSRARLALADAATPPAERHAQAAALEAARGAVAASGRRDLTFRLDLVASALHLRAGQPSPAALARARAGWDVIVAATPEVYRAGLGDDPDARLLTSIETELLPRAPGGPMSSPALVRLPPTGAEARLRRVLAVNRRLNSDLRTERILEELIDTAIEILGAERGFLLLAGDDGTLAVTVARNIAREDLGGEGLELSRSIAERAARDGAPIVAVDAELDERWSAARSVAALHLRSVLAVPLAARGKIVGALYVDHRLRKGAFQDDDVALVLDIADQAAIALTHAQHTRELERQRRELAELNRRLAMQVEHQAAELTSIKVELGSAREDFASRYDYSKMIGRAPVMRDLKRLLDRATASDIAVLIHGESGTGKELVARALHANGPRSRAPFVSLNCGALTETLLESELFGASRGAYTGADRDRRGLFEVADGGTLFLDEVGEMSPALQAKLLRVLQDGEVRRVGAERSRKVDVRIIAASNKDIARMVEDGRFREDLFYRLNVVRIDVPPLRERIDDLPLLVEHLLAKQAATGRTAVRRLSREAMKKLCAYRWPGNVRELENELLRASVLASSDSIGLDDLSPRIAGGGDAEVGSADDLALKPRVERLERTLIRDALHKARGNQSQAAKLLGLSRFGLQKKLKRYGDGS